MSTLADSLSDGERYAELIRLLQPDYPFMQLGYHFGQHCPPTSRTMRVARAGKNLIKKEYLGPLAEKTEQEIELLMAVAAKGLRHTASFKTIHAKTNNLDESGAPTLELLMKNYGLDLEDWAFLFRHGRLDYFESPYFHLAIWHHVLSAMKELHEANFVQVDVKADNICVAPSDVGYRMAQGADGRIAMQFNLKDLTLIDLGEALHPNPNKRSLLFHANGMALGPANDYISRHYIRQKALLQPSDMKPLRCLDWRVDFYALGCMIDEWNSLVQFENFPPAYLSHTERISYAAAIEMLNRLPAWLKSKDTDPSTEAGDLPHDDMLGKIGALLNLEKWKAPTIVLPLSIDDRFRASTARPRTPRSPAARQTLIESAQNSMRGKPEPENKSSPFSPGALFRLNRRAAKSSVDAVKSYRNVADRRRARRAKIDLLC